MRGAGLLENRGKQLFQFLFDASFQVAAVETFFQVGAMASASFFPVFPDCRRSQVSVVQSFLFVPARLYFVSH